MTCKHLILSFLVVLILSGCTGEEESSGSSGSSPISSGSSGSGSSTPPDDHGATPLTATDLGSIGLSIIFGATDVFERKNDTDCYSFVLNGSTRLRYQSFGDIDTTGSIRNSDFDEIAYNDDGGEGRNFLADAGVVSPGRYFVCARPYNANTTGEYDINISTGD